MRTKSFCLAACLFAFANPSFGFDAPAGRERPMKGAKISQSDYAKKNPNHSDVMKQGGSMARSGGTGTRGGGDSRLLGTYRKAIDLADARDSLSAKIGEIDWIAESSSNEERSRFLREELLPGNPVLALGRTRIDYEEKCVDSDDRARDFVVVDDGNAVCVSMRVPTEDFKRLWIAIFAMKWLGEERAWVVERLENAPWPPAYPRDLDDAFLRAYNVSLPVSPAPTGLVCGSYDNLEFVVVEKKDWEIRRHPDGRWLARSGDGFYGICH